ncbi:MAG TPA: cupin domain-containing protein [Burkholderiaceae bacterium]|nr:cupin domain-containing protein [Burkholderiaceae bacterium]
MTNRTKKVPSLWRRVSVAALTAGALAVMAGAANAGECPADKRVPDGQGQKQVTHAAKGVVDKVRSSIDLGTQAPMLEGRLFRLRQLDIAPGGIVPWHSHDERPAQIYIVKGEIVEYASNCLVPIVHKTGDVAPESKGTAHWWENKTKQPVVLISVDIFHDKSSADKKVM